MRVIHTNLKTMLLDDDPIILGVLARHLKSLGISDVVPVDDPNHALSLIRAEPEDFQLVICDLQMPKMDGVEFIRNLISDQFSGGVVLLSGEDIRLLQSVEKLAKAQGLNLLGVLQKPVSKQALESTFRDAMERDVVKPRKPRKIYGPDEIEQGIFSGAMLNYYQPKVELANGALVGVESLVRWRHSTDGLVYPDQFIETAERHGLIDALTDVVLEEATREARSWIDQGLDLRISINVSMASLSDLNFPEKLARAAAARGVPLAALVVEVTESQLMNDPMRTLDILTRMRLKRIGVSIDDFGTGHSSLNQLRDVPFDELKVDRGFVHGAWRNDALRAIVEASLRMGAHLRMKTVAEGVEDRADWDLLRQLGCDMAQGYFISRPMPGAALVEWAAQWDQQRSSLLATVE